MYALTRSSLRLLFAVPLVLATGSLPALAAGPSAPHPSQLAKAVGQSCVEYTAQAIYKNYGYDHWVHLRSACEKTVSCHASSDSNPSGVDQVLDPGARASVLLFRGSPASEFKATVSCRPR